MEELKSWASKHNNRLGIETAPVRNPKYGFGPLVVSDHPEMRIPLDMIRVYARDTPNAPVFGTRSRSQVPERPYVFTSYKEAYGRILNIARGMTMALGVKAGDRIGIFSNTREEVHMLFFVCGVIRCVAVPIYESIGPDAVSHIIRHSGMRVVFAAHDKLAKLHDSLARMAAAGETASKPTVVSFDYRAEIVTPLSDMSLADLEYTNESAGPAPEPDESERAQPDDVNLIMYTSGTTGTPKGVMITHAAALGSGVAIAGKIPPQYRDMEFVILSFMPLAHVFGLAMDYRCLGFSSGDIRLLTDDMAALRPTLIGGVPRVFQRVHDAVLAALHKSNIAKRALYNAAYWQKYWFLRAGSNTPYSDPVFFGAIREKLGGRLKILVSGGAPVAPHIMEWFRICVCDVFLEGYGMTETCAIGCSTDHGMEPIRGAIITAGEYLPYMTSETKLVSVPSMNYLVTDHPPRGELCIRSTTTMLGYYKDPEKTAEMIDSEGWIHTGDVALQLPNGRIRVIDRIKCMFKLSQGEYVSAEYLEQVFCFSSAVQQAFVYGDSQKNYPVAIIVPDTGFFHEWAIKNNLADQANDMEALCKMDVVMKFIKDEIARLSSEHHLKGYEMVKGIILHPRPFDDARDMLTPSLKYKRHVIREYFKKEIDDLYAHME